MRLVIALVLLAAAMPAHAQSSGSTGLRELKTDRPDKTEAAQTVDAGHFQIELDTATYTRERSGDAQTVSIGYLPFNMKYGVGRSIDVQVVVAPYQHQTVTDLTSGIKTRIGGFGDITLRVKHNLWGNDGGTTALALMPFVTLPTAKRGLGSDGVEFGLIVPLAVKLADGVDLGLMSEIDRARQDGRYHARYINSATIGFALSDRLSLYTELYTEHAREWIVTGDTGLTFGIGENTQLDAGINLGLTDAADDIGLFVGLSRRF